MILLGFLKGVILCYIIMGSFCGHPGFYSHRLRKLSSIKWAAHMEEFGCTVLEQ